MSPRPETPPDGAALPSPTGPTASRLATSSLATAAPASSLPGTPLKRTSSNSPGHTYSSAAAAAAAAFIVKLRRPGGRPAPGQRPRDLAGLLRKSTATLGQGPGSPTDSTPDSSPVRVFKQQGSQRIRTSDTGLAGARSASGDLAASSPTATSPGALPPWLAAGRHTWTVVEAVPADDALGDGRRPGVNLGFSADGLDPEESNLELDLGLSWPSFTTEQFQSPPGTPGSPGGIGLGSLPVGVQCCLEPVSGALCRVRLRGALCPHPPRCSTPLPSMQADPNSASGEPMPVSSCAPQASRDASPLHLRTQASPERTPPNLDVRAVSPVDRIEISLTNFDVASPQQPQQQPYAQLIPPDSPPPPPPPPPPMTDESDAEAADGGAGAGAGQGDAEDSCSGVPEGSPARSKSTKRVQLAVDVDAAAGGSGSRPDSSLGVHGKGSPGGGGGEGGVGMVLGGPEERGNGNNPQAEAERKRRTLSARKKGQYGFGSGVPRKSWLDPELAKKNMTQEEKERQAARAMLMLQQQASMRERGGGAAAVALMDAGLSGGAGPGAKGPPGLLLDQLGSSMSRQGSSTGALPGA